MAHKAQNIEHYEKRFGIVAIHKGYLTKDELVNALEIQVQEDIDTGTHRLLGEILLEQGVLSVQQVEAVLKAVIPIAV